MPPPRSASLAAVAAVVLTTATAAHGQGATYKYREDDGTVWFTDRPPNAARLADYEFLGYHGRPPARSSCRGLSAAERKRRQERIEIPLRRLSDRFGVDRLLIKAIISAESCFDPRAVSRVGARGLMQLMPATASELGVDDAFDINQNLRAGIQYFTDLRQRYPDDLRLALAAYNAGPAAVERHDGVPPYPETREYVERVLQRLKTYRLPSRP